MAEYQASLHNNYFCSFSVSFNLLYHKGFIKEKKVIMKSEYLKFLQHLLIYSAILGAVAIVLYLFLPKHFITPALPFLFFFFTGITLISYYILIRSLKSKLSRFVNTFLISTIVKLIIYIGIMIIYVLLNRSDAIPFMITFFILYLLYTVFEVVKMINLTRSQTQEK